MLLDIQFENIYVLNIILYAIVKELDDFGIIRNCFSPIMKLFLDF